MTVIADNKKRVTLPTRPGERFDVQTFGDEKFILTRLAPVEARPTNVTILKRAGFSVGKLGHLVSFSFDWRFEYGKKALNLLKKARE